MFSSLKRWFWGPGFIYFMRLLGTIWVFKRGLDIFLRTLPKGNARVYYGFDDIPTPGEEASGGLVKFQRMQADYPNSPRNFNILYMVSSRMPYKATMLAWFARKKGARIALNQNGVAYPAWHGPGWERTNAPMARILHEADYVFYQSEFCKLSADLFLGKREGGWEILYNAVDTTVFIPGKKRSDARDLVILLGGRQKHYYRFATAVKTLAILRRHRPDSRLTVTGRLGWLGDEEEASKIARRLVTELGLEGRVTFVGPYAQSEAPSIFQQAHLLLHTQYNDASPGLVLEAMACGLPVVYSHSGGVPELVGDDAGIGIPSELNWKREIPPDPEAMAQAVLGVADRLKEFSEAARQKAVDRFDLKPWLNRHREVFGDFL